MGATLRWPERSRRFVTGYHRPASSLLAHLCALGHITTCHSSNSGDILRKGGTFVGMFDLGKPEIVAEFDLEVDM